MHLEDLKDGRAFVEAARATVPKKPVVVLKAGPHQRGRQGGGLAHRRAGRRRRGLRRHPAAGGRDPGAGPERHAGVRAGAARAAHAPGRQRRHHHRRGRLGRAAVGRDRRQRAVADGDPAGPGRRRSGASSRRSARPGNPIDITGGEPPSTYEATIRLGMEDPRIHALVLGYWHTIVTPPMVFAELTARVVEEFRARGIEKPVVASLAGDTEVEEAVRVPLRARRRRVPVHDGEAGRGARREVPLGAGRGAAGGGRCPVTAARTHGVCGAPLGRGPPTRRRTGRGRWPGSLRRKGCIEHMATTDIPTSVPYREVTDSNGRIYRVGETDRDILGHSRKLMVILPWIAHDGHQLVRVRVRSAEDTLHHAHGWTRATPSGC